MYKIAICEDEEMTLEHTRILCDDILRGLNVEHEICKISGTGCDCRC